MVAVQSLGQDCLNLSAYCRIVFQKAPKKAKKTRNTITPQEIRNIHVSNVYNMR